MNNSKFTKFLSMLLAMIMLLSTFATAVFAEGEEDTNEDDASMSTPADDLGEDGEEGDEEELDEEIDVDFYKNSTVKSSEEKIATMTYKDTGDPWLKAGDYELYCDEVSGEVALKNTKTGEILLSNPYNLSGTNSDTVKYELLSQLIVNFKDLTSDQNMPDYTSFEMSAMLGQISAKKIKNGLRVEYSIGEEETRYLVPRMIERSRFEQVIYNTAIENGIVDETAKQPYYKINKLLAFYVLQDPNAEGMTDAAREEMYAKYPITKKMAVYVFDTEATRKDFKTIESYIETYCPDYTFAKMEEDHALVNYVATEEAPPLFKMALEYYLDEDGLRVTLPANSIRFDEDKYLINSIKILPYFGAARYNLSEGTNDGYVFVPDGSGALLDYAYLAERGIEEGLKGSVYGTDFAYHEVVADRFESMRLPIYGLIDLYTPNGAAGEVVDNSTETDAEDENEEAGDTDTGDTDIGDADIGDTDIGDTDVGDTDAGDTDAGNTDDGNTDDGNTDDGNTDDGNTDDGNTDDGNTDDGNTDDGNTDGNTDDGNTDAGDTDDGNTDAGDTDDGDTDEGDNDEGTTDEENSEEEVEQTVTNEAADRGFFTIIEEGDALATIRTIHGGGRHKYNSAYAEFTLRPYDSYNLKDAVSVGDDTVWTISSDRRYTGSYTLRIVMLGDEYEKSYVGMSKVYQDYLVEAGVLTALEPTEDDIPLFIESFGTMDTDSTFLSIPITVTEALTTFDNLKTMHSELSASGVDNINFRLTGFANGGMISNVPTEVEFQDEVGGNEGYTEFIKYAEENGITVYPDFDLSYAAKDESFDGYRTSTHATRSIDNRYTQKRVYYSSLQQTITTGLVCISPSAFFGFYSNINRDLSEIGKSGISLGTLGTDLNSDFDEDDPYNRQESMVLVQDLLAKASEDFGSVMVDGGNAYTWKYADVILNMSLDSSRRANASRSVPFMGMVLHGYMVYAGDPTNMASDIDYETLKIIENGAVPYFTLSFDKTEMLKDDKTLSRYYSVDYENWNEDVARIYDDIRDVLNGVQFCTIDNHEFLTGIRIDEDTNEATEHIVDDGTIVRVTYSNGTVFVLNYNRFSVEVEGERLPELSFTINGKTLEEFREEIKEG